MSTLYPLKTYEIIVDGHPLRLWEREPPLISHAVLLIHGRTWSTRSVYDLLCSHGDFSLMNGLAEHTVAAFGLDLRGYGETSRDPSDILTPRRAVEDISQVLEWIHTSLPHVPVYVFGWSFSGFLVHLLAEERPDLFQGLMLFGYRGLLKQFPKRESQSPERKPTTDEMARTDFLRRESYEEKTISCFSQQAQRNDPIRMDWTKLDELNALDPHHIRVPTLILESSHDPLTKIQSARPFFDALGSAPDHKRYVRLHDVDHAAFLSHSREAFIQELISFMDYISHRQGVVSAK